ncbi:MAG: prolyl oligopeptidase family serine peptidase [Gemmatimonadota bacterium]
MLRSRSRLAAVLLAALPAPPVLLASAAAAVAQSAFTVDDVLRVASADVVDLSRDGRWLVVARASLADRLGVDSYRTGDPTYTAPAAERIDLVDTRSGALHDVFGTRVNLVTARFSPDGGQLALIVHEDDGFRLGLYDIAARRLRWQALPEGRRLAGESGFAPRWSSRGTLVLPVRRAGWLEEARAEFRRLTQGPITVYKGEDPFLDWERLRRMGSEVELLEWDPGTRRATDRLDATTLGRGGFELVGDTVVFDADVTERTSYEVIFGATVEVRVQAPGDTAARTVTRVPEDRRLVWSDGHTHHAWADKGRVFLGDLSGGEARPLTPEVAADSSARAAGDSADGPERYTVQGVAPGGTHVLASSRSGLWLIDAADGSRRRIVERPTDEDEAERAPSWDLVGWSPDGEALYFRYASRTAWERGLVRYDVEADTRTELRMGPDLQGSVQLSEDGSTLVWEAASGNRPYDVWAADADLTRPVRLVESNPWLAERALGTTELIEYRDVDGDRMHGVLYHPAGTRSAGPVPTVLIVYETFFDDRFNSTIALLNAQGYAVLQPSVDLETGYPGEAWLKGVSAAANALIDRGIADPERLGVHGTSYGGYATNLLVTQTDRFAAAINISGKVDMISFYTDSPRLGVRNIHAPENSQDRLGATLWEQPQKYIAHSAIMAADRIETPLLLMTGGQDHNVPERTTMEMYYALRRLGKTVEWVSYVDGGHGMPRTDEAAVRDYHERILEWYERWLKAPAAATDEGR